MARNQDRNAVERCAEDARGEGEESSEYGSFHGIIYGAAEACCPMDEETLDEQSAAAPGRSWEPRRSYDDADDDD